jgi:hypothetical protein
MKEYIAIVIITIILIILAYYNFSCITNFNPFKGIISVPNKVVESFLGSDMNLLKNTDKTNPLLKKGGNKSPKQSNHRNLVFTSAGNNTEFDKLWIGKERNYDIMVVYYGSDDEIYKKYASKVDYILKRKGSKFQNFHYIYETHRDILDKYDRFFILDDDIIFKTTDINEMFSMSKRYDFWICGPTFKKTSECKSSHPVTITQPGNLFRYTNFVEVNVPMFNRRALDKFMEYYDPELIGWGIDFLYIWACGINEQKRFALVDKITCINPQDNAKKNNREMHNIKNFSNEELLWETFAKKHGIPKRWKCITLKTIKLKN